jgi:CO/xanthine dehydrogenase Mo-binding subunit
VAAARKALRPVRIVNRVDESMATTRRHGMRCRMQTAARADGTLLARRCTIELDTGAYADNGPRVTATAGDAAAGAYRWSAIDVEALCVYTNTSPAGSYRAFGACHLQWISELQVDEIARRAGIGAVEVRRRNLLAPGEEIRKGAKPLDADLVGDVEKVAAALEFDRPREPYTGVGLSVGLLAAGSQPVSVALARLEADGGALILFSSNEVGQGSRTVFTQIAAEELALPPERIRVHPVDTLTTPYDRSTGASRSTTLGGLALMRACRQVRERLVGIASEATGLPPEAFEARDGALHHEDESWTYASLVHRYFGMAGGELIGVGEVRPEGADDGSFKSGPVFWEVCVAAARVRVDPDTGAVTVLGTATAADVGRAINPALVAVQDEGGGMQGLGNALFEEMVFVEGELVNNNLLEYRVPTFDDMPHESACVVVENGDGPGPYGAKGVGEGAQAAVAAAIATALADAGVPMRELPLTPDRVWRRMRELEAEGLWPPPGETTEDERGAGREGSEA